MLIRRLRPPLILLLLFSSALFLVALFRPSPSVRPQSDCLPANCSLEKCPSAHFHGATCSIDGRRRIQCVRQQAKDGANGRDDEVFLPFNAFLRPQFDVNGHFGKSGIFEYFTSPPTDHRKNVDPLEIFKGVALRQRVKCLNPETGLPMSVQWAAVPYFYPVQILQFGLEHFTKNRTLANQGVKKRHLTAMDGARPPKLGGGNLLALEKGQSVQFPLISHLPILLFAWKATGPAAGFELILEDKMDGQKMRLEFWQSKRRAECVWMDGTTADGREEELHFVYGIESAHESAPIGNFLLDLPIFAEKAIALANNSTGGRPQKQSHEFVPKLLRFFGPSQLAVDSVRQQSSAHQEIFFRVADWLLKNQDEEGGWPVPVQRTFDIDEGRHKLVLPAGWHSAMAQGHALCFLTRVFDATGERRYLEAGQRALALFEKPASEGGVLNRLFGFDWFDEYPTTPNGTFVLNGFLYALIGLNDFSPHSNQARRLFQHGLHSLRSLLPLYDLGQRSVYDLRHIPLGSRPNIARWDYHQLHVSQLDWLHSRTAGAEPLLGEMARRWEEYARGSALKHN